MSTKFTLLTATVLVTALVLAGCSSQPRAVDQKADNSAPPSVPVADTSVLLALDKTGSVDPATLDQLATEIENALTNCATCQIVTVLNFGARGENTAWKTLPERFVLPLHPNGVFDEAAAQASARKKCGGRLACEQRLVREARERFDSQAGDALAAYREEHAQVMDHIRAAMLRRPEKEPAFTDLGEVADRIVQTPSDRVIWVTDGQHNGPKPLTSKSFAGNVLVVITPLADEQANAFQRRVDQLAGLFNNATVKPFAALDGANLLAFLNASQLPQI